MMKKLTKHQMKFNRWRLGGRGRTPIEYEYKIKSPHKDMREEAIKKDIKEICSTIDNLALLSGIHKIKMATIIRLGIINESKIESIPGVYELMKAIKKITK